MGSKDFEAFLDEISVCFINRDFSQWQSRIHYPFSLLTSAGPVVLTNEAELLDNFRLYLVACDAMRLDTIHRVPLQLQDCHDGTWIGTYQTNLLSNGTRATPPYTSSALLHEDEGVFKMSSIMNARGHHDWTGAFPDSQQ